MHQIEGRKSVAACLLGSLSCGSMSSYLSFFNQGM